MHKRTMGRFGCVLASVAAIAAIAAFPAPVSASGKECGSVTADDIGAAKITAYGVGCRKARRHVRRCIGKGELGSGWTASANRDRGKLKLTKDDKKIVALLEGGFTNTLRDCLAETGSRRAR